MSISTDKVPLPPELTVIEARPPEYSDEALALEFAKLHSDDLRYVAAWNKWLIWDGTRWKADETKRAVHFAREVCRSASARCDNNPTLAKTIASARVIFAVVKLAQADRRLAANTEQWDRGLWLLNAPGGTIDLQTGQMREHRRDDYCTKVTAVTPGGSCPRWHKFLGEITAGDQELAAFLCRMAGYALTGITRDHALFFLYGQGGNGKGVFVNAVEGAMGDYSRSAPMETFAASDHDRHPTELARLRGARLVTTSETESDRPWNEARIKLVTGGDRITARFLYQDFFEYTPQFKLWVVGNFQPSFRSVTQAIRRRLYLVPFNVTIRPIDEKLPESLRNEWPGILAEIIRGVREWQRIGLFPPLAVRAATETYLREQDTFGRWVEEFLVGTPGGWTRTPDLYESWERFAKDSGEEPGSVKFFVSQMRARGFPPKKKNIGAGFSDVLVRPRD